MSLNGPENTNTRKSLSGDWWIVAASLLWGTGGLAIKSAELGGAALSGARSFFAFLFFAVVWFPVFRRIKPTPVILAATVAYAGVITCFVIACKLTTAADAIILQYTAPMWVAILSWPILREKPTLLDISVLIVGFGGIGLCMYEPSEPIGNVSAGLQLLGKLLALASGLFFALFVVLLRKMSSPSNKKSTATRQALILGNLLAAAVGCLLAVAVGDVPERLITGDWVAAIWLGVGQLGLGYLFFRRGVETTTAIKASLICLLEPIVNPFLVFLFLGEKPTVYTLMGGGIVLGSLIVYTILQPKKK